MKTYFMYLHAEHGGFKFRSGLPRDLKTSTGQNMVTLAMHPQRKVYVIRSEKEPHNKKLVREYLTKRLDTVEPYEKPLTPVVGPDPNGIRLYEFAIAAGFRNAQHFENELYNFVFDHEARHAKVVAE